MYFYFHKQYFLLLLVFTLRYFCEFFEWTKLIFRTDKTGSTNLLLLGETPGKLTQEGGKMYVEGLAMASLKDIIEVWSQTNNNNEMIWYIADCCVVLKVQCRAVVDYLLWFWENRNSISWIFKFTVVVVCPHAYETQMVLLSFANLNWLELACWEGTSNSLILWYHGCGSFRNWPDTRTRVVTSARRWGHPAHYGSIVVGLSGVAWGGSHCW